MEELIKELQEELEALINIYGYDLVADVIFELFFEGDRRKLWKNKLKNYKKN